MLELLDGEVVGALPHEAKDMVSVAYHNSQRLIRLINDILDIEKIESGRIAFDLAPLPLVPLVEQAIAEIKSFAQNFSIDIDMKDYVNGAITLVDPDRLIQVLVNLLSNAIKFSPHGGAVTVTVERAEDSLRVSVKDCGQGIPKAFQPRLFDKFAQADSSDNKRLAGTGLGLAIVKKIVERLHGQVSFETGADRGTTFHVNLPEWCASPRKTVTADKPRETCLSRGTT